VGPTGHVAAAIATGAGGAANGRPGGRPAALEPGGTSGASRTVLAGQGVQAHHRALEIAADQVAYRRQRPVDGCVHPLLLLPRGRMQHVVDDLLLEAEFARMVDADPQTPEPGRAEVRLDVLQSLLAGVAAAALDL